MSSPKGLEVVWTEVAVLMYHIVGTRVVVVACFDGRRNLEDVLLSRLLGV